MRVNLMRICAHRYKVRLGTTRRARCLESRWSIVTPVLQSGVTDQYYIYILLPQTASPTDSTAELQVIELNLKHIKPSDFAKQFVLVKLETVL